MNFASLYKKSIELYKFIPPTFQEYLKNIVESFKFRFLRKAIANKFPDAEMNVQFESIKEAYAISKSGQKIKFNGQNWQDLIVHLHLQKTNGFFVDIGAHDGVTFNNSYFFEQYGWQGVCIEPSPDVYEALKSNRKCDLYNVAISNETGENVDFLVTADKNNIDGDMFGGIPVLMDEKVYSRAIEKSTGTIKVQTLTFDDLMKNYPSVTHIDFMSIDVEGAEMSILRTIDFDKHSFRALAIENNEPNAVLTNFMREKGYRVLMDVGLDVIFVQA